ncbi:MAG: hypothetical protein DIU69_05335 [Bacillota bacterium]|nr:MAG: hypothetical protein DIU69_05335 [Bacillota bacterium]
MLAKLMGRSRGQEWDQGLRAPAETEERPREFVLQSPVPVYTRTFVVRSWPNGGEGIWADLLALDVSFRVRFTVVPTAFRWTLHEQTRLRRLMRSVTDVRRMDVAAAARPEEVRAMKAIRRIRDAILYRGLRAVDVWCLVTVESDSPENLEADAARVVAALRARGIEVQELRWSHGPGFGATLPVGDVLLRGARWWPPHTGVVTAAAAAVPADTGYAGDPQGIYIGHDLENHAPVLVDFRREDAELNTNAVVMGASGEGKSTWLKAVTVAGGLLDGWHVVVLDVDGEYRALCQRFGGVWIDLSGRTGCYPDPCRFAPPSGDPGEDAARFDRMLANVAQVFAALLGGSPHETELAAVERATHDLLRAAGVDREDPATWDNARLEAARFSLDAVYHHLKKMAEGGDREARRVVAKAWRAFEGSLRGMFEEPLPPGPMPGRLVVLHLGNPNRSAADAQSLAVRYILAIQAVWEWLRQNRVRGHWTFVVVDEGQRVMQNPILAPQVADLVTTIRKWRGSLFLATNAPGPLWKGGYGEAVWANSALKVIFALEAGQVDELARYADVPPGVLDAIRLQHGTRRAVVRTGVQGWVQVRLSLPAEELELYRTRR